MSQRPEWLKDMDSIMRYPLRVIYRDSLELPRSPSPTLSHSPPDITDTAEFLNGSELEETTILKDKAFVIVIAILRQ